MLIRIAAVMVHLWNYSMLRLLAVLCIVLHGIGKTTVALSNSCEVTRSTIQVVDDCPDSEERWKEAAARKNCTAYASQCNEPKRLEYHCVINPYVNQTLEVCAYAQNIISGHCTSYSLSGNLILKNLRTNCSAFKEKPCPDFYRSDKAYNYPMCYELTKKSTTIAIVSTSSSKPETTAVLTTISSNGSSNTNADMSGKEEMVMFTTITFVTLLIIIIVLIYLWRKRWKIICNKHCRKGSGESNDTEAEKMNLNEQTKDFTQKTP